MRRGLSHFPCAGPTGLRPITSALGVLVLGLLLGAAPTAQATTVSFRFDDYNPTPGSTFGRSVIDPLTNLRVDTPAMTGGRFLLTVLSISGIHHVPDGGTTLLGFCIEPRQTVNIGGIYTHTVSPLSAGTTNIGGMGEQKADRVIELFTRYLQDFNAPLTRLEAGALQVAVWEIVREDSGILDVYSGDIYFTAPDQDAVALIALAQSYLGSLDGTGPRLTNLYALTNNQYQDIIVQLSTPEPPAMGILGLLFLTIGAIRLRRTQSL